MQKVDSDNKISVISTNDVEKQNVQTNSGKKDEHTYNYDDAINLTGNGKYNYGLLAVLSLTFISMGLDMFGFSVVVAGCSCDFQLTLSQKSILVSMPFVGPVFMSYPWGFVSDTRGRKKSLFIAMFVSFIVSTASAFSPSWVILAVLKFISTSFCSCAQSVTYAMLGESNPERSRGPYMLIMTSILMLCTGVYTAIGYVVLNLDFAYNLGTIIFTPWRLLVIVLAMPLGISTLLLTFFYESPKFLLNAGREDEALDVLKKIWRRNGGKTEKFPVQKLVLNEIGNTMYKEGSLLKSLWNQTVPLFKKPLLMRTLQLYYLTTVVYSSNNSFIMWFPFLSDAFFMGITSSAEDGSQTEGLCNMILSTQNKTSSNSDDFVCTPPLELRTVLSSFTHCVTWMTINLCISKLASRKKALMIIVLTISCASGVGSMLVTNNVASFILFICYTLTGLCIGFIFSYFIVLYPTSYRGMVACLGVMVARASALGGINLVGAFIMTHCSTTFYLWCAYLFSGVIVACFLPSDRPKKAA